MDIISLRLSGGRSMAFAVVRSGSSRIPVLIWAVNDRERPDFKSIPHFGYWDTGPGSSDHLRWTAIVRSAPYYPTVVALDLSALAAGSVHRVGDLRLLQGRPRLRWPLHAPDLVLVEPQVSDDGTQTCGRRVAGS